MCKISDKYFKIIIVIKLVTMSFCELISFQNILEQCRNFLMVNRGTTYESFVYIYVHTLII